MSYLNNRDRIRFGPVECIFKTPESFGRATRVSRIIKSPGKVPEIVLVAAAFVIILAILQPVFRVL